MTCSGSSCPPPGNAFLTPSLSQKRLSDPRNADLLVWVGDRLLPREMAKVSVFDSAVQGGDAVWEVYIYKYMYICEVVVLHSELYF
jgi:hypothetical protein